MTIVRVRTETQYGILKDPGSSSLKRIAWAFGCAKKGSEEEAALRGILVARARSETP